MDKPDANPDRVLQGLSEEGVLAESYGGKVQVALVSAKTGEGDKLFGSISNANISEALAQEGIELEKKFITVGGGLVKRLGKYSAKIRLHRDVIVNLEFEVISDKK